MYKFLDHTADIKIKVSSNNLKNCFKETVLALNEVVVGKKIRNFKNYKISKFKISGKDIDALLYNFIEEFVYLLDAKNFLACKIKNLSLDRDFVLYVELIGVKASDYVFSNKIKAPTYNEMKISIKKSKCDFEFVLDL